MADLVPHARVDIAFGTLSGRIEFDPDTFDDYDDAVAALFEGR